MVNLMYLKSIHYCTISPSLIIITYLLHMARLSPLSFSNAFFTRYRLVEAAVSDISIISAIHV